MYTLLSYRQKLLRILALTGFVGMLFLFLPPIAAAAGTTAVTPAVASTGSAGFVSLTGLPLFSQGAAAGGMSTFLNLLYQYLIGIAVILAVLEIMWGGFLIMGSGASVSSKEAGKNKVGMALGGLLLVLSPYIVFSLINPGALSLQIGAGNLQLSPTPPPKQSSSGPQQQVSLGTGCSIVGASDVLQTANCPSSKSTQQFQNLCGSEGGQYSNISLNKYADGTAAYGVWMCSWPHKYVFIDTSPNSLLSLQNYTSAFNTINWMQPLAVTSKDSNNASSAIQFAHICSSAGFSTCISQQFLSVPCAPIPKTSLPAGRSMKCYSESLTCRDYGYAHSIVASLCSKDPSWAPFQ
ncbi:MAG: hypothetical protein B7X04_02695 [Parcubacteria group bacterium 21-54-25]|nr:MAG: hypothetical protein B7X04_02695 [Parcubacteria group bacterium 21-54-25]HQU07739.1 hypothetical protein [Candidatus Paceibacterota bacterium]